MHQLRNHPSSVPLLMKRVIAVTYLLLVLMYQTLLAKTPITMIVGTSQQVVINVYSASSPTLTSNALLYQYLLGITSDTNEQDDTELLTLR